MGRRLTVLSLVFGGWSVLSAWRAMSLADDLSVHDGGLPGSIWLEVLIWVAPVVIGGMVAVLMASLPSSDVDKYMARNVRLGVMVAIFAVSLSWSLVLFAAYVGALKAG